MGYGSVFFDGRAYIFLHDRNVRTNKITRNVKRSALRSLVASGAANQIPEPIQSRITLLVIAPGHLRSALYSMNVPAAHSAGLFLVSSRPLIVSVCP